MRILITTRDEENWLLPFQLHFLAKNWPNCPFPIELLGGPGARATFLGLADQGTKNGLWLREAYCGDDSSWVKLLIWHLQSQNPDEPFLLLLNDYLVSDRINTERIETCARVLHRDRDLDFVRLNACPGPTGVTYENVEPPQCLSDWELRLSYFNPDQAYNLSLQPTIFRPSFLLKHLNPAWSIWDVETRGSKLFAAGYPLNAVGTHDTAFPVTNLLRRGLMESNAKKWMGANW